MGRILVIDDDIHMGETLQDVLSASGYEVDFVSSAARALELIRTVSFDVALLDFKMAEDGDLETFESIRRRAPGTALLLMTAFSPEDIVKKALPGTTVRFLYHLFDVEKVISWAQTVAGGFLLFIVDDESGIRRQLITHLEKEGIAYGTLKKPLPPDPAPGEAGITLLEDVFPVINAVQIYQGYSIRAPAARLICETVYKSGSSEVISAAIRADGCSCLYKPFDLGDLLAIIKDVFATRAVGRPDAV